MTIRSPWNSEAAVPDAPARQPTSTRTILARLKAETAARHNALERRLDIVGSLRSLDDYRALLGRSLGFYEPIEARLRLVEGRHPRPLSLDGRWKSERLVADL